MKERNLLNRSLNVMLAVCLALMAVLVFGNVVLRYVFHSGITWSEEMSRFLFIWMVFLGAVGALKDRDHLGVDMLLKRLSNRVKRVAFLLSHLIILYVLWILLDGSWEMTLINVNSAAPATGLPLSLIYGIGVIMSIGMAVIVVHNMIQVIKNKDAVEQMTQIKESEDEIMETLHQETADATSQQGQDEGRGER